MNEDKLRTILEKHAAWQRMEEGGERADFRDADLWHVDFRGADLRYVDFRDADLRGSDFRGSDFRGSDLRYADFRGSDFRGSDFRGSDLRYADLRGVVGFLLLPLQDPRGHCFAHAIQCDNGWRVRAGCRDFSIAEARAHWGDAYKGDREIADMYLHAIDWLEARIERMENGA